MSSKSQATPVMDPKPWPFPLSPGPEGAPLHLSDLTPSGPAVKPAKAAKTPSVHPIALILKGIAAQEKTLDEEIEQIHAQIKALEDKIETVEFRKRNLYEPFYNTVQQVSDRLNELYNELEYVEMPYVTGIGADEDWSELGETEFFTDVRLDNPRKKNPELILTMTRIDRWGELHNDGQATFDANLFTPEGLAKFKKECDEAVVENEKAKQEALEEERREEERRREQERIRAEERSSIHGSLNLELANESAT